MSLNNKVRVFNCNQSEPAKCIDIILFRFGEWQLEHFWPMGVASHCNFLRFILKVFFVLIKLTLLCDIYIEH